MHKTMVAIYYVNGDKKFLTDVIAIHKRREKLWIHTKYHDHFISNAEIDMIAITNYTSVDYGKVECFDASLDCPVKPYHTEDYDGETQ